MIRVNHFVSFVHKAGRGDWSKDGCVLKEATDDKVYCLCNKLGFYGVLIDVTDELPVPGVLPTTLIPISREVKVALSVVTYFGCGISLVALAATIATFGIFR